jgi:hypothetical protein
MLFTFAGSGHTNYTGYLLEMICDMELESSPALREAFLMSLLVNPTGEQGGFVPGDIYQEGLNRGIEPIIQHKDADFGSYHVRHIWARNIKDIQELKLEFRAGVGLAKRSGCHKDPHEKPEFKILLQEFKNAELHLCRSGRCYSTANIDDDEPPKTRDVDDMRKGICTLTNGGLKKWSIKTTRSRGLREGAWNVAEVVRDSNGSESEEEDMWGVDDNEDHDETDTQGEMTFGIMHSMGGDLVVEHEGDDKDINGEDEVDET